MFPVYIIHPRILLYYIAHFSPPIMWVLEIYITNVWSWSFTFRIHTYKMYIIVFRFHSAVGMIWVMDSIPWVHCASGNVWHLPTLNNGGDRHYGWPHGQPHDRPHAKIHDQIHKQPHEWPRHRPADEDHSCDVLSYRKANVIWHQRNFLIPSVLFLYYQ